MKFFFHKANREVRHSSQLLRLLSARSKRLKNTFSIGKVFSYIAVALIVAIAGLAGHTVSAQLVLQEPSQPLTSLKTVPIPEPANLGEFVSDRAAAIRLGKALFWDMQVGSDGIQACASCHFHAGTDTRAKNQLSPGLLRVNADGSPNPDQTFSVGSGPNYTLKPGDFPFHKLADPNNRSSAVLADSNDVAGSQGVPLTKFNSTSPGSAQDNVTVQPDAVFHVNGTNVRQVTERNTPSTVNAVFNFRNFWDGRAQDEFNGVNPFGSRDPNARVIKASKPAALPQEVKISLRNASLASQAVGPPLSSVEASATGRIFPDIGNKLSRVQRRLLPRETGKKLRTLQPLGKQLVAVDDSVLGRLSRGKFPGLKTTYTAMIKAAFKPEWWKSTYLINVDANGNRSFVRRTAKQKADRDELVDPGQLPSQQFTLMDYNFSLFMGLAIQMYESTLVSNNAPIDRYLEGNTGALTTAQVRGKELFEGRAKCINCHGGAEFTNASVRNVRNERLELMEMGNGQPAVYDNGFYNIGVRPTQEDLGLGGKDPFGNPLSETRLAQQGKFNALLGASPNITVEAGDRVAVDGAFKTPGLRNIELTAPYFHNGGQLTLRQVIDFYNRGGDFHEQNLNNLDPDIQNLNLSEQDKNDLVEFLKALTDERVRSGKAPFDRPQLFIPNGHPRDTTSVTNDGTGQATDGTLLEIPPVGRNGGHGRVNFLS
ncbi:cytochrome C peroxidase [Gloeocapsopsis sp. AAB1 = 1H9]|uniref:Cytochrome C peroxidase n=1 Tax=Gloeocapsopsis dulcis AAB1 = 1H9 TaxID=1433147 RepID=A0A6N8FX43_9CHRO|nr:cytochrome C peroxidase [Gloeocapsopsis dulcis AAB1 = 1H9]